MWIVIADILSKSSAVVGEDYFQKSFGLIIGIIVQSPLFRVPIISWIEKTFSNCYNKKTSGLENYFEL